MNRNRSLVLLLSVLSLGLCSQLNCAECPPRIPSVNRGCPTWNRLNQNWSSKSAAETYLRNRGYRYNERYGGWSLPIMSTYDGLAQGYYRYQAIVETCNNRAYVRVQGPEPNPAVTFSGCRWNGNAWDYTNCLISYVGFPMRLVFNLYAWVWHRFIC
jgi:hypothetical protein